jgi:hypothetical protein
MGTTFATLETLKGCTTHQKTLKTPAVTGICQLQGLLSVEGLAAEPRPRLEKDGANLPALIRNGCPAALTWHAQGLSWHRRPDSRKPGF